MARIGYKTNHTHVYDTHSEQLMVNDWWKGTGTGFFNTKMQLLFAFEAPFSLVVCGDELFPQWETHQFWNL